MRPIRAGVLWMVLVCAALFSTPAIADIPLATNLCIADSVETTPSSDFTALEGGAVVRHEPTRLEWRRCAEGMSWSGNDCTGDPIRLNWQLALQHADEMPEWRLPNISELESIVERCTAGPSINEQVFPNTPNDDFWSSSPRLRMNFGRGIYSPGLRFSGRLLRLVRGPK